MSSFKSNFNMLLDEVEELREENRKLKNEVGNLKNENAKLKERLYGIEIEEIV